MITVNNLSKTFCYYEKETGIKGSIRNLFKRKEIFKEAVKNVSFTIEKGEIVGFLGPNGAGKTTTLKMLSGILHPTSGEAKVSGFIPWERKDAYKRMFAFVAGQKSQLWPDLPALESFRLNRYIYEVPQNEYEKRINELVELFNVKDFLKVQARRLSLGERMKMELIASLIHSPRILFLDEPTIGLDVVSQENIRKLIKKYAKEYNTTIILTSHYMRDIEELCNRIIIINKGEKIYDGSLQSVRGLNGEHRIIKLIFSKTIEKEDLNKFGEILNYEGMKCEIKISGEARTVASEILESLPVLDISIEEAPIEETIAYLYGKGHLKVEGKL